jgi:hypothetical protein
MIARYGGFTDWAGSADQKHTVADVVMMYYYNIPTGLCSKVS